MQIIIVSIIILAALIYVGLQFARKVKSFAPKNSCGSDCGCGTVSKATKL